MTEAAPGPKKQRREPLERNSENDESEFDDDAFDEEEKIYYNEEPEDD